MRKELDPDAVRRALAPTAALLLLSLEPAHGYALVHRLRAAGFSHVRGGTLYPQLRSMEEAGLLGVFWDTEGPGPARKVLHLTDEGTAHLRQEIERIDTSLSQFNTLRKANSGV